MFTKLESSIIFPSFFSFDQDESKTTKKSKDLFYKYVQNELTKCNGALGHFLKLCIPYLRSNIIAHTVFTAEIITEHSVQLYNARIHFHYFPNSK
jgi:hypothetical protein